MGTVAVPPSFTRLPADVYFRYEDFGPDTYTAPHTHPFGQLNFVSHGVMNIDVAGARFLSPSHYAVWVPPHCEHSAYNAAATAYRAVYIAARCARRLPPQPCTLQIDAILRAILVDFAERDVHVPASEPDRRLARVLLDRLEATQPHDAFLPYATSPELQAVLQALQAEPANNRPLAGWAARFNMTARTLERRCQQELGLTLGEWRQRLRFLRAVEWLDEGRTVQQIAFDLGYSTPSAFIAMFRRQSGTTPERYRMLR